MGRSEGHTEGNWVHSSLSEAGGGEGGKDTFFVLILNKQQQQTSSGQQVDKSCQLTSAAAVLIQSKPMTTLQEITSAER